MQRSHRLKSSWLLNGPLPKLPVTRRRGDARSRLGEDRRDLAVLGIDHEPRPAAFGDLVDVAELGRVADLAFGVAAEELGSRERVFLTTRDCRGHFLLRSRPGGDVPRTPWAARMACWSRTCSCNCLGGRGRPTVSSVQSNWLRPSRRRAERGAYATTGAKTTSAARHCLSICVSRLESGVTLRPGGPTVKST